MYRLGNAVPVPYVNTALLESYFNTVNNTILGLWNTMSGGSFSIGDHLRAQHPALHQRLHHHPAAHHRHPGPGAPGQGGRRRGAARRLPPSPAIPPWPSALVMGIAYYNPDKPRHGRPEHADQRRPGIWPAIVIIMTFMAGSTLIMWMGEQITEFGVGNGISIILFASIIARFPTASPPCSPTWATAPWPGGPSFCSSSALSPLLSA